MQPYRPQTKKLWSYSPAMLVLVNLHTTLMSLTFKDLSRKE